MNIVLMWLYRLVGKPWKIGIDTIMGSFIVTQITVEREWNNIETIKITLRRNSFGEK